MKTWKLKSTRRNSWYQLESCVHTLLHLHSSQFSWWNDYAEHTVLGRWQHSAWTSLVHLMNQSHQAKPMTESKKNIKTPATDVKQSVFLSLSLNQGSSSCPKSQEPLWLKKGTPVVRTSVHKHHKQEHSLLHGVLEDMHACFHRTQPILCSTAKCCCYSKIFKVCFLDPFGDWFLDEPAHQEASTWRCRRSGPCTKFQRIGRGRQEHW